MKPSKGFDSLGNPVKDSEIHERGHEPVPKLVNVPKISKTPEEKKRRNKRDNTIAVFVLLVLCGGLMGFFTVVTSTPSSTGSWSPSGSTTPAGSGSDSGVGSDPYC